MIDGFEITSKAPAALVAYWRVLSKGRWFVFGSVALIAVGVLIWTVRQPKIYVARTSVMIEPSTPHVLNKVEDVYELGGGNHWATKEFFETQYRIIASREVARRVVERYGLDKDLSFLRIDETSDNEALKRRLANIDPVLVLVSRIKAEPVRDSRIVNVAVEDTDPRRAALLSNAVAEVYIDQNLEQKLGLSRSATEWLSKQLSDWQSRVHDSEMKLYEFKNDRKILSVSLEDQMNMTSARLKSLNEALSKVQVERLELGSRRKALDALRQDAAQNKYVLENVIKSGVVPVLKQSEVRLKELIAELQDKYGEQHPKIVAVRSQLAQIQQELTREVDGLLKAIDTDYQALTENEKALKASLEEEKRAALALSKLSIEYNRMRRESDSNQEYQQLLLSRLKETDLTGLLRYNNLRKLDPALVPRLPVRPDIPFNLFAALLAGLVIGVGLAFLADFLDSTVKTQQDVSDAVGAPFMGMIPKIPQEEMAAANKTSQSDDRRFRDLFPVHHPHSAVAECFRAIRTNLIFMSAAKPLRTIVVTSAGPQEGKSTTAAGLSIILATSGARVLLVDTDMRRPRLHLVFGVSNDAGVSSLLVDACGIDTAVKATEVPGLDVLPCGPIPPNPAELLHTPRFRNLIQDLSAKYDRVVFDSPPIIAVTDAMVLATQMDGVLLVVKAGRSAKELLKQAVKHLHDINANLLGAVLNDLDLSRRRYGDAYYKYYRHYGRYYRQDADEKVA